MANGPTCGTAMATWGSACGVRWAAGSGQWTAGGGGRGACGGRQAAAATMETVMRRRQRHAAMCGSSPLVVTAMLFDIRYSTLLFLCWEHLKRYEKKNEIER
jgi:hypothetical protein